MWTRVLSRSLWHFYDALGGLLVANLLWAAATIPLGWGVVMFSRLFEAPLSIVLLGGVLPVAFLNPTSLALGEMTQRLAETGETDLRTFWWGLRRHAFRGMALTGVGVLATLVLGINLVFYGNAIFTPLGKGGNTAATGVILWALLWTGGMSLYWVPVAVEAQGKSPRVGFTLWRSALWTLQVPGLTAAMLLTTVIATLFWTGTGVGMLTCGMSFVRVLHAETFQVLRERQEALERLRHAGKTPSRKALREELHRLWATQSKRRLRELLRPWEMP